MSTSFFNMNSLAEPNLISSLHDLVDKPFLYISVVPEWPKCHGVFLRRLSLENISINVDSCHDLNHLAESVLHVNEIKQYRQLPETGKRRLEWLFGRVAAKDVLRQWTWQTLDIVCTPVEVEVAQNEKGKPFIKCQKLNGFEPVPDISITHYDDCAIAALSLNGSQIGIDFENIKKRKINNWINRAFTEKELSLVQDPQSDFLLSLWTAKEAASKALGTGLMGRWRDWRISEISDDHSLVTITHDNVNYSVRLYQNQGELLAICQI